MNPWLILFISFVAAIIIGILIWYFLSPNSSQSLSQPPTPSLEPAETLKSREPSESTEAATFTSNVPYNFIKQKNLVRQFDLGPFTIKY